MNWNQSRKSAKKQPRTADDGEQHGVASGVNKQTNKCNSTHFRLSLPPTQEETPRGREEATWCLQAPSWCLQVPRWGLASPTLGWWSYCSTDSGFISTPTPPGWTPLPQHRLVSLPMFSAKCSILKSAFFPPSTNAMRLFWAQLTDELRVEI